MVLGGIVERLKRLKWVAVNAPSVILWLIVFQSAAQSAGKEKFDCKVNSNQCVYPEVSRANTSAIARDSKASGSGYTPDTTTHRLSSGKVVLGISRYGGGYINYLYIPEIGRDIVGRKSSLFGRGGQSSIRDELHGRKYNPTQAGFTDTAGTVVKIVEAKDKRSLSIPPHNLAGFNGDGEFDFTENKNLAPDRYKEPGDWDGLKEKPGNQDQEVRTEFDYWGRYTNCKDETIRIPCFKHDYQYRFVRTLRESHFMKQFIHPDARMIDGSPALKERFLRFLGHDYGNTDLVSVRSAWSFRFDNSVWDPRYRFDLKTDGRLSPPSSRIKRGLRVDPLDEGFLEAVILASSSDPNRGIALGFYRPSSPLNTGSVVRRTFDGRTVKVENRTLESTVSDNRTRIGKSDPSDDMSLVNFLNVISALYNPGRFVSTGSSAVASKDRQYEMIRNEVYLLVGTPETIRRNILKIRESSRSK